VKRPASDFRRFVLGHGVVEQAQRLGLFGNVEKRVLRMARHSAPFTHHAGNRRFEGWVLRIEQGVVVSIKKLDPARGQVIDDVMGRFRRQEKMLGAIDRQLGDTRPDGPPKGKGPPID
jgi:hypothetical protein